MIVITVDACLSCSEHKVFTEIYRRGAEPRGKVECIWCSKVRAKVWHGLVRGTVNQAVWVYRGQDLFMGLCPNTSVAQRPPKEVQ